MKKFVLLTKTLLSILVFAFFAGCQNDDSDLREPSFSKNPLIFTDEFIGMNGDEFILFYGDSNFEALSVDRTQGYESQASIKIDVPNADNPSGNYAGGIFRVIGSGRDLSGYNALTFWVKASRGVTIDQFGFGEDFIDNKYIATLRNVSVGTGWTKVIIPIPDPSKLTNERGLFRYAAGTQGTGGFGYALWIDEIKFEKLGTIVQVQPLIENGQNITETSFIGINKTISGIQAVFNMPNGTNQNILASTNYFQFLSSDTAVATVNEQGIITTVGQGTAVITAKLGNLEANGSVTIQSSGNFNGAPVPTRDPSTVISLFSNAYSNVPVDYYNGFWQPFQTTQSADFTVNGDNVLHYTNFNFVGIQFSNPTINATAMTHFHANIYIPGTVPAGAIFRVEIVNFGANGVFGGGDDSSHQTTITTPTLVSQNWITVNIPFTSMTSLNGRQNLGQVIFIGQNISNFYADNIYFYNGGTTLPITPTVAAPIPTLPQSSVISVFSNSYTNIAGTDLNPNWGQATQVAQVPIQGNTTLRYTGLNYQGIQLGSAQNLSGMNFLHLDYYTANSSLLRVYLISPGPVETPRILTVPTSAGWNSIDIPLSQFSPVNLTNVIQLKFDGNGDIFLDNIYFRI